MDKLTWTYVDKSKWSSGPWEREPDKIQWRDAKTKLICIIHRNLHFGNLCGYVGVPQGHPFFMQNEDNIPPLRVHGGVTFADFCEEGNQEYGICHRGREKLWWIGFDCGHSWDMYPGYDRLSYNWPSFLKIPKRAEPTYKNVDYVRKEVTKLAKQLDRIKQ